MFLIVNLKYKLSNSAFMPNTVIYRLSEIKNYSYNSHLQIINDKILIPKTALLKKQCIMENYLTFLSCNSSQKQVK